MRRKEFYYDKGLPKPLVFTSEELVSLLVDIHRPLYVGIKDNKIYTKSFSVKFQMPRSPPKTAL